MITKKTFANSTLMGLALVGAITPVFSATSALAEPPAEAPSGAIQAQPDAPKASEAADPKAEAPEAKPSASASASASTTPATPTDEDRMRARETVKVMYGNGEPRFTSYIDSELALKPNLPEIMGKKTHDL